MNNNSLPLGTVVKLKGIEKKIFIISRDIIVKNTENSHFDYLGYPYPEGFTSNKSYNVFNNNDIEYIIYKGYIETEDNSNES